MLLTVPVQLYCMSNKVSKQARSVLNSLLRTKAIAKYVEPDF